MGRKCGLVEGNIRESCHHWWGSKGLCMESQVSLQLLRLFLHTAAYEAVLVRRRPSFLKMLSQPYGELSMAALRLQQDMI